MLTINAFLHIASLVPLTDAISSDTSHAGLRVPVAVTTYLFLDASPVNVNPASFRSNLHSSAYFPIFSAPIFE